LVVLDHGNQGGKEYLQTLKIGLIPFLNQLFPINNANAISIVGLNDFAFMQDNAPCHKASIILRYLQQNSIPIMWWPANSVGAELYIDCGELCGLYIDSSDMCVTEPSRNGRHRIF